MRSFATLVSLFACVLLLGAGCPRITTDTSSGDSSTGGSSSGSGGSGGGSTGAATTTAGGASSPAATDSLAMQFPGCDEVASPETWTAEVLRLVNVARQNEGADPLVWNGTLAAQAEQYACEMIFHDFFAHQNPVTGTELADRADQFGYEYTWIGENLAAGQTTPAAAVEAWMQSPCHRQNILHPAFTELGVGIRYGGEYGYYWVQEFGRPVHEGVYAGPPFHVTGCNN